MHSTPQQYIKMSDPHSCLFMYGEWSTHTHYMETAWVSKPVSIWWQTEKQISACLSHSPSI
jgi:hypothetical protein